MNNHKLKMNEIASRACAELQTFLPALMEDTSRRATENRYLVFRLMEEAGYTHSEIAEYFKMTRETVTKGLAKLDDWLRIYPDMKGKYTRMVNVINLLNSF
jgi:hypothetical protein